MIPEGLHFKKKFDFILHGLVDVYADCSDSTLVLVGKSFYPLKYDTYQIDIN